MIDWKKYETARAEMRYAVANSPMFLFDGLREEPEVQRIAGEESAADILESLEQLLQEGGDSLSKTARPYILVAAASLKGDRSLVQRVAEVVRGLGGWLSLLAQAARDMPPPPTLSVLRFNPPMSASSKDRTIAAVNTATLVHANEG